MQKNLDEVSFLRPILILLLVAYHSFIIYDGGWSSYSISYEDCFVYMWISKLTYSAMLPLFVFISGYVWGYQKSISKSTDIATKKFFFKKIRRLLFPCWVFSFFYILIFIDWSILDLKQCVYSIIFGIGHLWFLPMLFWCFVYSYILSKVKYKLISHIIVVLLALFFVGKGFCQLNYACQYFQYFWFGLHFYPISKEFKQRVSVRYVLILFFFFAICFVVCELFRDYLYNSFDYAAFSFNFPIMLFYNVSWYLEAWIGIVFLFSIAYLVTSKYQLPNRYVKLGEYCMGVYLFQQFIILYLYSKTSISACLGLALPWVTCVFSLILSFVFTYLLRLTKIGKNLC